MGKLFGDTETSNRQALDSKKAKYKMTELKDWITEFKTKKPELNDFVTKLEGFISDTGFNAVKFEKAVELGLQKKEEEIRKTFIADAEN